MHKSRLELAEKPVTVQNVPMYLAVKPQLNCHLNLAACTGISHFVAQAKVAQSSRASFSKGLLTYVWFDRPCIIQLEVWQLFCCVADQIAGHLAVSQSCTS